MLGGGGGKVGGDGGGVGEDEMKGKHVLLTTNRIQTSIRFLL